MNTEDADGFFSRESLRIPFGESIPTIIGDCQEVALWAFGAGFDFHFANDLDAFNHDCVIIVCASAEYYAKLNSIREQMCHARVLWVPLAAFHGVEGPLGYGLEQLARSSLHRSHLRKVEIADTVNTRRAVTVHDRTGSAANFQIPQSTRIAEAPRRPLKRGEFLSAISYFEVETEYSDLDSEWLQAEGELVVDCALHARSARYSPESAMLASIKRISAAVSTTHPARMRFKNGHIVRFMVNGIDVAEELEWLAGSRLGLRLSEFSIGLNKDLRDINWTLNSPLNEGVSGIHVGLGDGYSGLHLDFICASAEAEFNAA